MIERDPGGLFLCHKVNPLVPDYRDVCECLHVCTCMMGVSEGWAGAVDIERRKCLGVLGQCNLPVI